MMKKLIPAAAVTVGMLLSAQANAAPVPFTGSTTEITPINCPALDNNITVQLSKGVFASFDCDNTSLLAAACHQTGTNKSQTLECVYYTDITDPLNPVVNPLPAYAAAGCTAPIADPVQQVAITGRLAFGGSSSGGRVTAIPLGDGVDVCDSASIVGATPTVLLDTQTSLTSALQ